MTLSGQMVSVINDLVYSRLHLDAVVAIVSLGAARAMSAVGVDGS